MVEKDIKFKAEFASTEAENIKMLQADATKKLKEQRAERKRVAEENLKKDAGIDKTVRQKKKDNLENPELETLAPEIIQAVDESLGIQNNTDRTKRNAVARADVHRIATWYEEGLSVHSIADIYDISVSYVYAILRSPEAQEVRQMVVEESFKTIKAAFDSNMPKLNSIMQMYLKEAEDPERVKSTGLVGLFSVIGIMTDKAAKLEELSIRKQELDLKRQELETARKANEGLLAQFSQILAAGNTLPATPELQAPQEPPTKGN